jgi:hypothetical protein
MEKSNFSVSGWVNFPTEDPVWKDTGEGGMVVKLVVCDNREFDEQFGECSGVFVADVMSNSFIGDDRLPEPEEPEEFETLESLLKYGEAISAWEEYHFPRLNEENAEGIERYVSRGYLAVIILGSTDWSGWNESEGKYWVCKFADLTEPGKALYKQIETLYPGCELHLLTFLDT